MKKKEVRKAAFAAGFEDASDVIWHCTDENISLLIERERERAAMICHQLRDVEYPADDIATRIMAKT